MTRVTVAIPTAGRADYLRVALASIAPQVTAAGADLLVILDGPDPDSARLAAEHGARTLTLAARSGLNVARNAAFAHSDADAVIFVDDDVSTPAGWLRAHLDGLEAHPDHEALGGPIHPWLEGGGPRHCGREPAPITTLEAGGADRDIDHVWGANLAVRRSAIERIGGFDETLNGRGDEEEWLDRLTAAGGHVRYLAAAGLTHRRVAADASLARLSRAGYALGRAARANDVRKAAAPTLTREVRDLAGALWHALARRCGYGVVFVAHALGRIRETLDPTPPVAAPGSFSSGHSGYVAGVRALTRARVLDALADLAGAPTRVRLDRHAARRGARRRVQVLALECRDAPNILAAALEELGRSRHDVRIARTEVGDRGRFENLNRLLAGLGEDLAASDWLIVLDDDVALPPGFLDRFLFLAERHRLTLAQPAHRALSHAAWPVTRRRVGTVLRETAFVEIGPLVAFHRDSFATLLPFPPLRVGWGLDAHWAALATERQWRIGVVDAAAIGHALRPVAVSYDPSAALAESRAFLAQHVHLTPVQANRTLVRHRRW